MGKVPDGKSLIAENEAAWLKSVESNGAKVQFIMDAGPFKCTLDGYPNDGWITEKDKWVVSLSLRVGQEDRMHTGRIWFDRYEFFMSVEDVDAAKLEASKIILNVLKNFRMLSDRGVKELSKQSKKAEVRNKKLVVK